MIQKLVSGATGLAASSITKLEEVRVRSGHFTRASAVTGYKLLASLLVGSLI